MDHDWSGWPEDEPHLGDHLGDADTADLHEPGGGLGDLGGLDAEHGLDGPGFDAEHYGAFDHPDAGHDAGSQPYGAEPDDAHDYGGQDYPHELGGHEYNPQDYGLTDHDDDVRDLNDAHDAALPDEHDAGPPDGHDDHTVPGEHLVGTDPDVDTHTDDPAWYDHSFPPALDLEQVPEPVDGFPWSDPTVLGHGLSEPAADLDGGYGAPPVSDLFEYSGLDAGTGGDAWAQLIGSDDPATGALARWWGPAT